MKKVQLERMLQSLAPMPAPRPDIEQYPTPPGLAAEVVYVACGSGDVADRHVLDAGCGNGVLAIAAKLLGAAEVLGVDVDPRAIEVAELNARRAGVDVTWLRSDISAVEGSFDTVLMNPPFGSQTRHADLPFLDKALNVASVIYSFHNAATEEFTLRRIASRGGRVTGRTLYEIPLAHAFPFHQAEVRKVAVVLLRTEVTKG